MKLITMSQLELFLMVALTLLLVDMIVVPIVVLTCNDVQLLEMVTVMGKFVDVI
jgi:hypothetical protein